MEIPRAYPIRSTSVARYTDLQFYQPDQKGLSLIFFSNNAITLKSCIIGTKIKAVDLLTP